MAAYDHLTIMYSLPRSMTQWWRWFMSHGCHALHDPLARCSHPDQLKKIVDAAEGERMFIADTSAILFHDRLQRLLPGHKRMYMFRPPQRVAASLAKQGYRADSLDKAFAKLARSAYSNEGAKQHFGLQTAPDVASLFEWVTGERVSADHALQMLAHKVDTPLRQQYRSPAKIRSLLLHKDPL